MIKFFKKTFIDFLLNRGYKLTKITSPKKVKRLIKSLFPLRTQFELIRMGPDGDGGYLVPDCLEGIEYCFSPGVSDVSGFELDCISRGMYVFMADKSVDKPNLPVDTKNFNFIKKFIGNTNDNDFITIDEWVKSSKVSLESELLLQMDIEGAEYEAIASISESLMRRFRIMIIEFHFLDKLWKPAFYNVLKSTFEKILITHVCVHNHPNNCCGSDFQNNIEIHNVIELTFVRKDCVELLGYETTFPHKLDFDNTPNECLPLARNWYYNNNKQ